MAERQTKIVVTVGPASRDAATLAALIDAGADAFRIDFGDADCGPGDQARIIGRIRKSAEVAGRQVTILGDLPRANRAMAHPRERELAWVELAAAQGVDILCVPFVSSAADLSRVSGKLDELRSDLPLVAKIERPSGVRRIDEVLGACDGIVVARGALGAEIELAKLPRVQKTLIRAAGMHSKASVTMSHMLASMVEAARPTRAEATDVANAIFDGTDALMLCDVTAIGAHPVEAVRVMDSIARATEPGLPRSEWLFSRTGTQHQDVAHAVAQGAVGAVYRLGLRALVVPTATGRTARLVSAHRPEVRVLAISPEMKTVRRLGLLSGVTATVGGTPQDTGGLLDHSARLALACGVARSGDLVGITGSLHGHGLGTNLFGVHRVP